MQKGNEREKVVLLGFLKDLAGRMGNEAFECRWLARSRNGGIDALRQPLHAEAMRRGLGQAAGALVIADGAVWIWRLADDRFSQARQRLDYYQAVQHLAAAGRTLFGEDNGKLRDWLRPLVKQLKNRSAIKVIHKLEEIPGAIPTGAARVEATKEINYLREHQNRMDYRAGSQAPGPILEPARGRSAIGFRNVLAK